MPNRACDFELTIDGQSLSGDAKRHLSGLTYEESLTETARLTFSIVPSELFGLSAMPIKLNSEVSLSLGLLFDLVPVFTGNVVRIYPEFPEREPARLQVMCYDKSCGFKRVPPDRIWTDISAYGVIEKLATMHGLGAEVHPSAKLKEFVFSGERCLNQVDETDWGLLDKAAKAGGYNLFVKHSTLFLVDDDYLAGVDFQKLMDPDRPLRQIRLVYRPDAEDLADPDVCILKSFQPEVGTRDQRTQVEFISWSSVTESGEKLGTGKLSQEPTKSQKYTEIVVETETVETLRITGEAALTASQAKMMARAELHRRASRLVEGQGVLANGFPALRMGQRHLIEINAMPPWGQKFTGEYMITAVKHAIDRQGVFTTEFDIKRDGLTSE